MSAQLFTDSCHFWTKNFLSEAKTKLQNLGSDPSPSSLQIDGNRAESVNILSIWAVYKSPKTAAVQTWNVESNLSASVMFSLSRIWRDSVLQLKAKIRLYQALVMSVLLYAAETRTLLSCDEKTLEAFDMKCQRQIFHTLVSAYYQRRSISAHRLTTYRGPQGFF